MPVYSPDYRELFTIPPVKPAFTACPSCGCSVPERAETIALSTGNDHALKHMHGEGCQRVESIIQNR